MGVRFQVSGVSSASGRERPVVEGIYSIYLIKKTEQRVGRSSKSDVWGRSSTCWVVVPRYSGTKPKERSPKPQAVPSFDILRFDIRYSAVRFKRSFTWDFRAETWHL